MRCFRPPHPHRQTHQAARIEPLARQRRHEHAQSRPRKTRIAIRSVLAVADAGCFQGRDQTRFGDAQERTHEEDRRLRADWKRRSVRHAGEPGQAAAAGKTQQHRFRLIIERVRGQDMLIAGAHRGLREERIARDARRFLQSGFRLYSAPAQRAMRHAEPARQPLDRRRFASCFRAQPMIDGDGKKLRRAFAFLRPARGDDKERR